jgi:uncharacterized protein DUF6636
MPRVWLAKPLAFGVVLTVAALAGCGGGDTTTVVVNPPAQGGTTATTPGMTQTTTETAPSDGPTAALHPLKTPSGNIGCQLDVNFVRCDIRDRDWPQPPKPAGCPADSDWGQGVEMDAEGEGQIVCAGDTALDEGAPVLDYGASDQSGSITCQSETAGVTCRNGSGHGFFLSKQSYRFF